MKRTFPALALLLAAPALAGPDGDTKAWWATTKALSDDSLEGRDTGSPGHARAVQYVIQRFKAAGLQPAGENGGWTQTLRLHDVTVEAQGSEFAFIAGDGSKTPLKFLHDITPRAAADLPARIDARLRFAGYCSAAEMGDMRGKVALCFGNRHTGLPTAADRLAAATTAGAAALINVDDPDFSLEPARWPDAYARTVHLADAPPAASIAVFRLNAGAFAAAIAGSGRLASALLTDGSAGRRLESFDVASRFTATMAISQRDLASDNVLGRLPGSDPAKARQTVVVAAHLDGYGRGEAVAGDAIYNGAFDDAAYVATLIQLAANRRGKGFARPVIFAAFTGEEKGLLGAQWFVDHPTVPKAEIVAAINLDQLRPLFPLRALTMHGLNDTTLGATARRVAETLDIAIRPDREPERNLNRRADHWPFLAAGIPATGFVFAFDPRSPSEALYREWYVKRYHRPQDDIDQPWDPRAARDFNRFFYALTAAVADAPEAPRFLPDSPLRPR